jgi:hypothetical protein
LEFCRGVSVVGFFLNLNLIIILKSEQAGLRLSLSLGRNPAVALAARLKL